MWEVGKILIFKQVQKKTITEGKILLKNLAYTSTLFARRVLSLFPLQNIIFCHKSLGSNIFPIHPINFLLIQDLFLCSKGH